MYFYTINFSNDDDDDIKSSNVYEKVFLFWGG